MWKSLFSILIYLLLNGVLVAQNTDYQPLFNTSNLDGWIENTIEEGSIAFSQGVLTIDGRGGWLQSEGMYSDFILLTEVKFLTDDADSGIFVRVINDVPFILGWPGNSYQVQVRDMSENVSDNPIWFGNIYRHRVSETGETIFNREIVESLTEASSSDWFELEIVVSGSDITVSINGNEVTKAANIVNSTGYLGIQVESGLIEYRNMRIMEL